MVRHSDLIVGFSLLGVSSLPEPSRNRPPAALRRMPQRGRVSLVFVTLVVAAVFSSAGAQEVRLQLDEYHRMLARAELLPPTPIPAAAPFALERANLDIELGETTARITTRLTVSVFAEGWQEIPLATSGQVLSMTVGEPGTRRAGTGSEPTLEARLESAGKKLLARGRGRHTIVLEEAIDLGVHSGATRNRRDLNLRLPAAASVFGSIKALPGDQLQVTSGAAMIEDLASGGRFVGEPGKPLRLFAQGDSPVTSTANLPLRFSASVFSELHLWRLRTSLSATVVATVLQGALDELQLALPEGFEVQYVDDGVLSGWDVEDGVLTARLLRPQRSNFNLYLRLEAPLKIDIDDFASPVLMVPEARRTRQIVGATVHGAGILNLIDVGSGVERDMQPGARPFGSTHLSDQRSKQSTNSGAGSEPLQRSPAYQLNNQDRPPQWRLVWPEQTEVLALRVDSLVLDTLVGAEGSSLVNLTFNVSNRGSQSLQVKLPNGFRLVRAERDGLRIRPGTLDLSSSPFTQQLVLSLDGGTLKHRFTVTGVMPVSPVEALAGRANLVLELPSLNAPITSVLVRAQLPDSWRYRLQDPARVGSATQMVALGLPTSLLKVPPGFVVLHASWSAMSSQPDALEIRVLEKRNREEWF